MPYEDIFEARVTLTQSGGGQGQRYLIRVELLLVGRTLVATQTGASPPDTVDAALRDIARQLQALRILRPGRKRVPSASPSAPDTLCSQWQVGGHEDGCRLAQTMCSGALTPI